VSYKPERLALCCFLLACHNPSCILRFDSRGCDRRDQARRGGSLGFVEYAALLSLFLSPQAAFYFCVYMCEGKGFRVLQARGACS
jgi:hypothetical protein